MVGIGMMLVYMVELALSFYIHTCREGAIQHNWRT